LGDPFGGCFLGIPSGDIFGGIPLGEDSFGGSSLADIPLGDPFGGILFEEPFFILFFLGGGLPLGDPRDTRFDWPWPDENDQCVFGVALAYQDQNVDFDLPCLLAIFAQAP
jgi:hypothetical protein